MTVEDLWNELGNIPISEDDEIEESFYHFKPGTHREYIWAWFTELMVLDPGE